MKINKLISILEKKLNENLEINELQIQDKSFLHKNHASFDNKKFHIKLLINSKKLNEISSLQANRKIFNILKDEMHQYIHSLQIKLIKKVD